MASGYRARVTCPFCGSSEMQANPALARCSGCGAAMDHGFYRTLLQIRSLDEARDESVCKCCGRKDRRPGGTRCPACGGEIPPRTERSP